MNKERLFKDYRSYLSTAGLHEVFAVDYIAKLGERYGLDVYRFRDKLVALVRHGDEFDISFGANVIVSHLDSPRLDVLVGEPLVEKEDGVFLKVIPYGGIIPQSWLDIPLVLVGRIYTDEEPIVINGNEVIVEVGSVAHPMVEEHYIEWIVIETKKGCQKVKLSPADEPKAKFILDEGDEFVEAYEYCNLHGLWKSA